MPDPIEAVKRKREGHQHLQRQLDDQGPRRKRRRHGRGVKVPAEERRDEVGGAEEVEAAAQHGAGDAVQGREGPAHLGPVDAQVGRHGAMEALGGEDGVGVGFGGGLGCGGSSGRVVRVREGVVDERALMELSKLKEVWLT